MANDSFQLKALLTVVDKMTPALKGIQRSVRATNKSLHDLGTSGSGLASKLGIPAALLSGASVAGLVKSVGSFMEYGGQIDDMSKKLGVNAERLQELQYAAKLAGASPEALNTGLAKLNKGLADVAAGKDKDLAALFKKMGISIRDANGKVKTASDLIPQLADSFKKNETAALRARMAVELFGKGGQDLIPMLSEGSEKIQQLSTEARSLGIVLETSEVDQFNQVKSAAELDDTFDKLKYAVRGLGMSIGAALAPTLNPILTDLIKWIQRNRELVASIAGVSLVIVGLLAAVAGLREIGGALFRLIPSLYGTIKAFGSLLIANPILASIVVAVGLLGYAAYKVYQNWEPIAAWFGGLWESVKATFASGVQYLNNAFLNWTPLGLIIKNWEPIAAWFENLWERIRGFIDPILKGIGQVGSALGISSTDQVMTYQSLGQDQSFNVPTGSVRPSLLNAGSMKNGQVPTKENAEVVVRFENSPPGTRVEPGKTNNLGIDLKTDVGYRGFALGS